MPTPKVYNIINTCNVVIQSSNNKKWIIIFEDFIDV